MKESEVVKLDMVVFRTRIGLKEAARIRDKQKKASKVLENTWPSRQRSPSKGFQGIVKANRW